MNPKCLLFFPVFIFLSFFNSPAQPYKFQAIDSAKRQLKTYAKESEDYFKTCLFISGCYKQKWNYDSAQAWLDTLFNSKELEKRSALCYLYNAQQLRIYYTRNLHQIGINEGKKALELALELKDSLLVQDAYAILGLFYYNVDSTSLSIEHFNKALRFTPAGTRHIYPMVLFSNYECYFGIAQNYSRLHDWSGALVAAKKGLSAAGTNNYKGIAEISNLVQLCYYHLGNMDSSLYYTSGLDSLSDAIRSPDYKILAYIGYVKYYDTLHRYESVLNYYKKGIDLIKTNPELNVFYAQEFLYTSIKMLKKYNRLENVIEAMELSRDLAYKSLRNAALQTNGIENATLKKERKILEAELSETRQKQTTNKFILVTIILSLGLLSAGLLWFLYHQKQKLAAIERTQKISRDLHDDIGASLSSINIYGDLAANIWSSQPEESKKMLDKITGTSKDLMNRMGDIVWSMKPADEQKFTLEARLKNYCTELLTPKNIIAEFQIDEKLAAKIINPEVRKNLLLISKEAINNIAKYSSASVVKISLQNIKPDVQLRISDNGKGFNENAAKEGNGLHNIKRRCAMLKGNCTIENVMGKGVTVTCNFPIAIISYKA